MLGLIRRYLDTGVMMSGVVIEPREGTPQGGPRSPLLANVLLDEVDKELERRGHAFVRHADDCNVYVRSRNACADASRTVNPTEGGQGFRSKPDSESSGKPDRFRPASESVSCFDRNRCPEWIGIGVRDRSELKARR